MYGRNEQQSGERTQSVPNRLQATATTVSAESEELVIVARGGWRGLEQQ